MLWCRGSEGSWGGHLLVHASTSLTLCPTRSIPACLPLSSALPHLSLSPPTVPPPAVSPPPLSPTCHPSLFNASLPPSPAYYSSRVCSLIALPLIAICRLPSPCPRPCFPPFCHTCRTLLLSSSLTPSVACLSSRFGSNGSPSYCAPPTTRSPSLPSCLPLPAVRHC